MPISILLSFISDASLAAVASPVSSPVEVKADYTVGLYGGAVVIGGESMLVIKASRDSRIPYELHSVSLATGDVEKVSDYNHSISLTALAAHVIDASGNFGFFVEAQYRTNNQKISFLKYDPTTKKTSRGSSATVALNSLAQFIPDTQFVTVFDNEKLVVLDASTGNKITEGKSGFKYPPTGQGEATRIFSHPNGSFAHVYSLGYVRNGKMLTGIEIFRGNYLTGVLLPPQQLEIEAFGIDDLFVDQDSFIVSRIDYGTSKDVYLDAYDTSGALLVTHLGPFPKPYFEYPGWALGVLWEGRHQVTVLWGDTTYTYDLTNMKTSSNKLPFSDHPVGLVAPVRTSVYAVVENQLNQPEVMASYIYCSKNGQFIDAGGPSLGQNWRVTRSILELSGASAQNNVLFIDRFYPTHDSYIRGKPEVYQIVTAKVDAAFCK